MESMTFTINGEQLSRSGNFETTYSELAERVGESSASALTITWAKADGRSGSILPGQSLVVTDGTRINVAAASSA